MRTCHFEFSGSSSKDEPTAFTSVSSIKGNCRKNSRDFTNTFRIGIKGVPSSTRETKRKPLWQQLYYTSKLIPSAPSSKISVLCMVWHLFLYVSHLGVGCFNVLVLGNGYNNRQRMWHWNINIPELCEKKCGSRYLQIWVKYLSNMS